MLMHLLIMLIVPAYQQVAPLRGCGTQGTGGLL